MVHGKQQKTDLGPRNHSEVAKLFQQFTPGDHTTEPQLSSGARQDCEIV